MTLPYTLPDWVPWWVNIAILVPVVLFALAFVLMPFSVIGVKGRLESVEMRLDEIQGEIRSLALRLPEPGFRELETERPERGAHGWAEPTMRPPIPPAQRPSDELDRPPPPNRRVDPTRGVRAEPRFDPR
jgi:hypothetical protein